MGVRYDPGGESTNLANPCEDLGWTHGAGYISSRSIPSPTGSGAEGRDPGYWCRGARYECNSFKEKILYSTSREKKDVGENHSINNYPYYW